MCARRARGDASARPLNFTVRSPESACFRPPRNDPTCHPNNLCCHALCPLARRYYTPEFAVASLLRPTLPVAIALIIVISLSVALAY